MISVITPVYNGEQFIESCIKNMIEQNCSDMEHIIVDGGSSDRTVEIIKRYSDQYPHIRWISEKDQGQSDAMNKGIRMAKGEIIGMLNVDDFYEPDAINKAVELFQGLSKPSFLVGNCNILEKQDRIKFVNKPSNLNFIDLISLKNQFPLNPSAYFYHKELHQKIGYYPIDEHYMMDLDFILKAVRNANTKYVDELWGNHRQIEGTKTMSLMESGNHYNHLIDLLLKHRKQLPMHLRLLVIIRINILSRFNYFINHPDQIIPSITTKLETLQKGRR